MKNRETFITNNGLTMIKCFPLCFQAQTTFKDGTGPITYSISIGGMTEMYICCYDPDKGVLIISNLSHDNPMPALSFKVESMEEASDIANKFAKGMDIDMRTTIFTHHTHQKGMYLLKEPDNDMIEPSPSYVDYGLDQVEPNNTGLLRGVLNRYGNYDECRISLDDTF